MRTCIAVAFVTAFSGGVIVARSTPESPIERAASAFWSARVASTDAYRSSLAEALDDSLQVEVLVLDFRIPGYWAGVGQPDAEHSFELWRGAQTRVIRRRILSREEVAGLLPPVKQVLVAEWPKGFGLVTCYYPTHAIRVMSDGDEVFRMSVACRSYTISYPDETSERRYLATDDFQSALSSLMPLSSEEEELYRRLALGEVTKRSAPENPGEPGATDNPDGA